MNYSNYSFTLNLQIHQSQVSIPVSLNDTARKLYITFIDGRKPYTIPDGCRAIFVGFKPDGTTLFNDCIIQENKTVVYEFTEQTANVEGIVNCEIRLYGEDGKQLTSSQFIMIIDEHDTSDISLSENESTAIDSIIHAEIGRVEAEAAREAAEKSRKELADFLATSGGVIVSDEEPQEGLANVWLDDSPEKEEIRLLDSTDITQELADNDEKIPSVALLKKSLDEIETGASGKDGLTPYIKDGNWWIGETDTGVKAEGKDGKDGINGIDGKDGAKGADGYTPIKGVDYYTEADKTEIAGMIVEMLGGNPIFGIVDENNNIILSGNLADGDYTVKYEMEDGSTVGIGNLVLDTNVYYSVTNNLTNCTNNNSASEVIEGESYSATISANSGYELKSVTVTMGGESVAVTNGVINIANVTGDIVITAVAEEQAVTPTYTNLIPTLTDIDLTMIYNGVGYKENTRISISNISTSNPSGEKTQSGTTLLGLMPLGNNGDVLHLRGAKLWDSVSNTYSGLIWYYNASGELLNTSTISVQEMGLAGTDANGDATFTMTHSKMKLIDGAAYIRLNVANPTGELIMTRNQLIPQN